MAASGEQAAVRRGLSTRPQLAADLRTLGVPAGGVLLVHASLSCLGWVAGGPVAVVQALLDTLGPDGTLVVPTHTGGNSDPAGWTNPPVPTDWWPAIRAHLPGYHPKVTPSRGMGAVAEAVRTWPMAVRSGHPQVSFAAVGPRAEALTAKHSLAPMLGEGSPLSRLRDANALVLLLGVGHEANTALHLAEYGLAPVTQAYAAAISAAGERKWVSWQDRPLDAGDFPALGAAYEAQAGPEVRTGRVGAAPARLLPIAPMLAFAGRWLAAHRRPPAACMSAPAEDRG